MTKRRHVTKTIVSRHGIRSTVNLNANRPLGTGEHDLDGPRCTVSGVWQPPSCSGVRQTPPALFISFPPVLDLNQDAPARSATMRDSCASSTVPNRLELLTVSSNATLASV
jgi:hypothetical protein